MLSSDGAATSTEPQAMIHITARAPSPRRASRPRNGPTHRMSLFMVAPFSSSREARRTTTSVAEVVADVGHGSDARVRASDVDAEPARLHVVNPTGAVQAVRPLVGPGGPMPPPGPDLPRRVRPHIVDAVPRTDPVRRTMPVAGDHRPQVPH